MNSHLICCLLGPPWVYKAVGVSPHRSDYVNTIRHYKIFSVWSARHCGFYIQVTVVSIHRSQWSLYTAHSGLHTQVTVVSIHR